MATEVGGNLVEDSVVFGYDTNIGVADNNTSTILYPGKPAENKNVDPYHSTKSAGDTVTLAAWGGDTGVGSFEVNTSPSGGGMMFINHNTSNPAGSGGVYTDFPTTRYTLTNGVTYTRSWWAKADDTRSASGHICSCNRDSTNTYIVGGSVSLNTNWQRYSHTFTYTGPTSDDWQFRHIIYDASKVYIANVQLEAGSVVSPFVNGTRSSTESLIDLKRAKDIDVSNMSFNSNGQISFDGSNDIISVDVDDIVRNADTITIEGIVNTSVGAAAPWGIQTDHASAGDRDGFWFHMNIGGYTYFRVEDSTNGEQGTTFAGSVPFVSNVNQHVVTVVGLNHVFLYIDGELKKSYTPNFVWNKIDSSKTAYLHIGRTYQNYYISGDIPVLKMHNRGLTASEVKQNYQSYKKRFNL